MAKKSLVREEIEKIAPFLRGHHVYCEGYPVMDPEKGGYAKGRRFRMKWVTYDRDLTDSQREQILAIPGVRRVSHTGSWYGYSAHYAGYSRCWSEGVVVTFDKAPKTIKPFSDNLKKVLN